MLSITEPNNMCLIAKSWQNKLIVVIIATANILS